MIQRKEMNMAKKYKKFSPEEKVRLLRLHLIEKEPVSDICDRHGINPNNFYNWQKVFFENGAAAFAQNGNGRKDSHSKILENRISKLQAKIANKDEVIAEIMSSHIELKKSLGEI
jgi:transposase-like protein